MVHDHALQSTMTLLNMLFIKIFGSCSWRSFGITWFINLLRENVRSQGLQTDPCRKRVTSFSVGLRHTVCSFICGFIAQEIMDSVLTLNDHNFCQFLPCAQLPYCTQAQRNGRTCALETSQSRSQNPHFFWSAPRHGSRVLVLSKRHAKL